MKNSKLVHYLNEGIIVLFDNKIKGVLIGVQPQKILFDLVVYEYDGEGFVYKDWCSYDTKPYLYPLSCLTEEIPFNGKMVVPLVELAKVEGAYCGEGKVNICSENYIRLGVDTDFWYDSSFYKVIDANIEPVNNQLKLFELLLKMKINIFPDDIESIDPRSELANPYL